MDEIVGKLGDIIPKLVFEDEKLELRLNVQFDCVSGQCDRYIVGTAGDEISGALYIRSGKFPPVKYMTVTFKKEKQEPIDPLHYAMAQKLADMTVYPECSKPFYQKRKEDDNE